MNCFSLKKLLVVAENYLYGFLSKFAAEKEILEGFLERGSC